MEKRISYDAWAPFVVGLLISFVLAGKYCFDHVRQVVNERAAVTRNYDTIQNIYAVLGLSREIELVIQRFRLTHDETGLSESKEFAERLDSARDKLIASTAHSPAQQRDAQRLIKLTTEELSELEVLDSDDENEPNLESQDSKISLETKRSDEIRTLALAMKARESELLKTGARQLENTADKTFPLLMSLIGLGIASVIVSSWQIVGLLREYRKARDDAEESNERYELIVEGSADGIWDINLLDGEMNFPPRWLEQAGYDEGELTEGFETFTSLIHPDDRPKMMSAFQEHVAGATPIYKAEFRLRTKDGQYRWLSQRGKAIHDDTGKAVRVTGSNRDITDLVNAQTKYLESEKIFRQLSENIREMFWMGSIGAEELIYISPVFEEVTGISLNAVYDNPRLMLSCVAPEDRQRALEHIKRDKRTKTGSEGEYKLLKADGTPYYIWAHTFPVHDEKGEVVSFCGVAHDINQRKEAEKRVSEFYSTVSHELRTPLTSIRGSLGLIEGGLAGEIPEKAKQFIAIARSESDRLIRLINDILDIRKIEAGKLTLSLVHCSPAELISSAIDGLRGMAMQSDVEITSLATFNATLLCDRDRIIQVLANLISNAIKYSEKGRKVAVSVDYLAGESVCRFSVIDRGQGIAGDQIHKLFNKFQQLDSSDSRPKGGTGLGLAISKSIVEQHGGKIGVNSFIGQGSAFWFELPAKAQTGVSTGEDLIADYVGKGLLLSSDEHFVWLLRSLLALDDVALARSESVEDAEAALLKFQPTFLLIDSDFKGQCSDLLTNFEKQNEKSPKPKVVFVEEGTVDTTVYPDRTSLLTKPIDLTKLRKALIVTQKDESAQKVLVVADDASTRAIVANQITAFGAKCIEARNGTNAVEIVKRERIDLIVLDLWDSSPNGFELVDQWRKNDCDEIPMLVYTSQDLTEAQQLLLTLGRTKHLIKTKNSHADFQQALIELLPRPSLARS
jgi:PAS domain S-box-containing protein